MGGGIGALSWSTDGLAGGVIAGNARLNALRELVGVLWRAVALVALFSAIVGLDDLGGVWVGSSNTRGLAVDVGDVALEETARGWGEGRAGGGGSNALGNSPNG